jgi:hypothetical protein
MSTALIVVLCILTGFIIYSRGISERQKPYVHVSFPHSAPLFWQFEERSTMFPAPAGGIQGYNWLTEVVVPFDAYNDRLNVDRLRLLDVQLFLDMNGFVKPGELLEVTNLDDGSVKLLMGYTPSRALADGESVTVILTYRSLTMHDNLVPFTALRTDPDNGGHYILLVRRTESFWGRRHIAERVDVQFLDPSVVAGYANIDPGLQGLPIIIHSQHPIYEGANVRIFD